MNKRTFLKSVIGVISLPFVSTNKVNSEEPKNVTIDRLKLSHLYPGAYACPNDLWTPEEIIEAGFVFVDHSTCIHRFDDPYHPIMKSYCKDDPNLRPIVMKTSRFCNAAYIKTYDLDKGRVRGIESVGDYLCKKDIFKPMILEWMKEQKFHYVHRVLLEDSPCSWISKFGDSDMIFHRHAVYVRGCKLPIKA